MGYKLELNEFIKTLKGIVAHSRMDTFSTPFSRVSQSFIQNDMIFNLLIRIDGKLTKQGEKIMKIDKKLQNLENLVFKEKEDENLTFKDQTRVKSSSSERIAIEQFDVHASDLEDETSNANGEKERKI